ncbi:tetratricopeptide repeat protein [Solimonas sp. SE-A11]|uniref:tetratricopeptide repeat protein n=1 Tax=Solimonas sp. SE-A11 TaxID=3054954 RepID=UPI00259C7F02|nr:tetratricopeptide repeat protein [Solimonas sp. SE-A11]MDM4768729.1 tetratricopeptide repeat protein [Solimonas sp. SE-A11]
MSEVAEPRTEILKRLLRAGEYASALPILDQKLAERPDQAPLHWHRSHCLSALGRQEEALAAVLRVIELNPDFAKAWLRRAELTFALRGDYPEREGDLQLAVALDGTLAPAHRALALIRYQRGRLADAEESLDQALALDSADGEGHALRALWAGNAARRPLPGEDTVPGANGALLSRARLESAVSDLRRALPLVADASRYRMQLARRLQDLGRHAEAVTEYELLLAALPGGHVLRNVAEEMRRQAWEQGAAERAAAAAAQASALASRLEAAATPEPEAGRRSVEDDLAASLLRNAAEQMRQGKDLSAVLEPLGDGEPDTLLAIGIADKLFQLGHQPASELQPVPAEIFPAFMRRHAAAARQQLAALGFSYLGDFDPRHLAPMLSESTLLRCYLSSEGGVALSFALRPAWPGWIGWLRLRLARQARSAGVIEFGPEFDDGHFLVTNNGGDANAFGPGPQVGLLSLVPATSAERLFENHVRRCGDYLRQHPQAGRRPVADLAGLVAMQDRYAQARNAYRQSIGYATDQELHRLLGPRRDLAERVRGQLARLAAA